MKPKQAVTRSVGQRSLLAPDAQRDNPLPPLRAKDLQLKYRGGTPSLYLVETLGEWTGRRYERIADASLWQQWLQHLGLPLPAQPADQQALAQMRALRAAIYQVVQAVRLGQPVEPQAVACVNHWAGQPPPALALADDGVGQKALTDVSHQQLLALIARDAIDLLTGPLRQRIRQCASAICPVLFVDRSRRGDRIWCSATCGARLATARYRHRNGQPAGNDATDADDPHDC